MSSSINVHYRRRYHGIKIISCLVVLLCIVISLTNGSSINIDNNNKKKTERIKAAEKKVKLAEAKLNRVKEEMTKAKMELKQSVDHLNKVSSSIVLKEEYKFQENKILSNEKVQKDMKEIEATQADQGNGLNAMLGKSATQREIEKVQDIDNIKYLRSGRGSQMSWIEHSGDGQDVGRSFKILKTQTLEHGN